MRRIALLVALALSLLPSGAAAEPRAAERETERQQLLRDAADYGIDALRSDNGLGALRFQRTDRLRETSTRTRADGPPPPAAVALPAQPQVAPPARTAPESDPVSPLCERLPYHSTAPPSRR